MHHCMYAAALVQCRPAKAAERPMSRLIERSAPADEDLDENLYNEMH
jgi:hypothetical protein